MEYVEYVEYLEKEQLLIKFLSSQLGLILKCHKNLLGEFTYMQFYLYDEKIGSLADEKIRIHGISKCFVAV